MRAGIGEAQRLAVVLGPAIEFAVIEQPVILHPGTKRDQRHLPGIGKPVHPADLIAIECRDRQFADALLGTQQLHDDFRIEVKAVGIEVEGNPPQRVRAVEAITGMEFAQPRAEQPVLQKGQHAIAGEFVERHAALARAAAGQHARSHHRVGAAIQQRLQQGGQQFRRVLAVAMDQGDDVESMLQGVLVADLLIAAIALVAAVDENTQGEGQGPRRAHRLGGGEGAVA